MKRITILLLLCLGLWTNAYAGSKAGADESIGAEGAVEKNLASVTMSEAFAKGVRYLMTHLKEMNEAYASYAAIKPDRERYKRILFNKYCDKLDVIFEYCAGFRHALWSEIVRRSDPKITCVKGLKPDQFLLINSRSLQQTEKMKGGKVYLVYKNFEDTDLCKTGGKKNEFAKILTRSVLMTQVRKKEISPEDAFCLARDQVNNTFPDIIIREYLLAAKPGAGLIKISTRVPKIKAGTRADTSLLVDTILGVSKEIFKDIYVYNLKSSQRVSLGMMSVLSGSGLTLHMIPDFVGVSPSLHAKLLSTILVSRYLHQNIPFKIPGFFKAADDLFTRFYKQNSKAVEVWHRFYRCHSLLLLDSRAIKISTIVHLPGSDESDAAAGEAPKIAVVPMEVPVLPELSGLSEKNLAVEHKKFSDIRQGFVDKKEEALRGINELKAEKARKLAASKEASAAEQSKLKAKVSKLNDKVSSLSHSAKQLKRQIKDAERSEKLAAAEEKQKVLDDEEAALMAELAALESTS